MPLSSRDLAEISRRTLENYERSAEMFWAGTRDHDVSQNIIALLEHIDGDPPCTLLDFGCGPGRDLKTFRRLGHSAIGLEGTPRFAEMARAYSGCEVWEQDFLELDLPAAYFDGVFANAALFHVPKQALPRVLRELHVALKPARQQRGGLEQRPVRRVSRPRSVARLYDRRGFRRTRALLSAGRVALCKATLARECVAQAHAVSTSWWGGDKR